MDHQSFFGSSVYHTRNVQSSNDTSKQIKRVNGFLSYRFTVTDFLLQMKYRMVSLAPDPFIDQVLSSFSFSTSSHSLEFHLDRSNETIERINN